MDHSLPIKDVDDGAATSIKSCLDYLYRLAMAENYLLTAHFIGAAAESLPGHLPSDRLATGSNGRYRGQGEQTSRVK